MVTNARKLSMGRRSKSFDTEAGDELEFDEDDFEHSKDLSSDEDDD